MNRELDGVYFRVQRDCKWQNICFSDLTPEERDEVGGVGTDHERSAEWWRGLAYHLADCLKEIGDMFDIKAGKAGYDPMNEE